MLSRRIHNKHLSLGIILFLAAQSVSVGHAIECATAPHTHDDTAVCWVIVNGEHDDQIPNTYLAAAVFKSPTAVAVKLPKAAATTWERQSRPPATGPPAL